MLIGVKNYPHRHTIFSRNILVNNIQ
uniref:Uncharacterized protein n=1 Tax=Anguilla anguilla TaxID=7936 RepID=A0A0E9VPP3_ANGAN